MSIPPINAFNMQPVKEALPIRTQEGSSVKYNLGLTVAEITAVSFVSSTFAEAMRKNVGYFVVATHAKMRSDFAEFQDKNFSIIPQAERSDLETLMHSLWEKTRNYLELFLLETGDVAQIKSFQEACQEADRLAHGVRIEGKQCEVLNNYQMLLLNHAIASTRKTEK
jgi:hypothetical protein